MSTKQTFGVIKSRRSFSDRDFATEFELPKSPFLKNKDRKTIYERDKKLLKLSKPVYKTHRLSKKIEKGEN